MRNIILTRPKNRRNHCSNDDMIAISLAVEMYGSFEPYSLLRVGSIQMSTIACGVRADAHAHAPLDPCAVKVMP